MELNKYIEHTLLKQDATKEELTQLFNEAINYKFYGVCINPTNVKFAKEYLKNNNTKIVTVVGFPLGQNTTESKVFETINAIENGADEIDMVINVGKLKDKDYNYILKEILLVKKACKNNILKVILETDLLNKDEIKIASEICVQAKANFVKTSTGFVKNGIGAKIEDVTLMHTTVNAHGLGVKASGGIKDKQKAIEMLEAGATRIGTSSGVNICK